MQSLIKNPIAIWLFTCAAMVFAMIIVGAITRLTDSGLSMVEWRPLFGALPPMNDSEWNRVFSLYQQSPEFQTKHSWMMLGDFKKIFFWEWFHRLLGRMIGLVYALPLFYFWIKGAIPKSQKPYLLLLLILGGCQGLMGWYMVQSGLIDNPAVSHYRLAAHLSLALILYSGLIWIGLRFLTLRFSRTYPKNGGFNKRLLFTLCCITITIIWGAFVAGLDAGLIYNEFPRMGAGLVPSEMGALEPWWKNMLENHAGVQFTHRWIAIFTVFVTLSVWVHGLMTHRISPALHALGGGAIVQMSLGIMTLLSNVALPVATLHQAGAVILLSLILINLFQNRKMHQ